VQRAQGVGMTHALPAPFGARLEALGRTGYEKSRGVFPALVVFFSLAVLGWSEITALAAVGRVGEP